jgi:3-oxoacyl-[acyl-carrier protein] reductase
MQADLSQSQQVTALFDRTEQQFGAPDILVNLAGVRYIGAIADMDDDAFDKMFDLNTKGAFFCMREAARRLNNNGRIVNISSGLVVRPPAGYGLYVGSKAAVEHIGKVLSIELGDRGITVNSVAPGPTATDEFKNSVDEAKAAAAAARSPFFSESKPIFNVAIATLNSVSGGELLVPDWETIDWRLQTVPRQLQGFLAIARPGVCRHLRLHNRNL